MLTVRNLTIGRYFNTNIETENQTLIKHKCVFGTFSSSGAFFYSSMSSNVNSLFVLLIEIRLNVGANPSFPLG